MQYPNKNENVYAFFKKYDNLSGFQENGAIDTEKAWLESKSWFFPSIKPTPRQSAWKSGNFNDILDES